MSARVKVSESNLNMNMNTIQKRLVAQRQTGPIVYYSSGLFENNNSIYRIVFMKLPDNIWYVKAPFIKMMLEKVFDGNEVPYWVTSLREIFIRKQPHGPNQLDRTKRNNGELGFPKSMITFTHKLNRTASLFERHSLSYAIAKIHNIFANNVSRLNEVLHSWLCENQRGIIRYFTEKWHYLDQEALLIKFKKDINKTFKARRVINTDIALDYFLLDWDIKKFVKNDIGLNHWPKSKLHYIYGRSREGSEIPEFGRIQKHTIK